MNFDLKKVKTSDLIGPALDWVVLVLCEDEDPHNVMIMGKDAMYVYSRWSGKHWSPSFDWVVGGPIIEREGIELKRGVGKPLLWAAFAYDWFGNVRRVTGKTGPTPLIAAMRCYVTSKLGAEVEIPEELLK